MSTLPSLFPPTVFVLAALTVSSCAPTGNFSSGSIAPQADNSILVSNRNWADIKVYALRGGSKY